MKEKRTFLIIFALLAVLLAILPFLVSFNEVLTYLVEKFRLYMWVQERIVPLEVKMVGVLVTPLGVNYLAHPGGMTVNGTYAQMTWNCLGWQSLLLLAISLGVGLQGHFTTFSKIESVLIGVLGTFLINVFRMVFVTVGIYYMNTVFALLIHDYFAALTTIVWLMFFWWFSYSYVLEERIDGKTMEDVRMEKG